MTTARRACLLAAATASMGLSTAARAQVSGSWVGGSFGSWSVGANWSSNPAVPSGGGYALFVKNGKPTYEYNFLAHERFTIAAQEPLRSGPAVVRVEFKSDGGIGQGGLVTLHVNDRKVAEGRVEKTVPFRFGAESFDVGMDCGSPVSDEYAPPFAYAGKIKQVEIELLPTPAASKD